MPRAATQGRAGPARLGGLPSTKQLSKTARGFSKKPQGRLPMLPKDAWEAARKANEHPKLAGPAQG